MRTAGIPLLALALAACAAPGGRAGGGAPDGRPEVTWELDLSTLRPREGDLAAVTFRIRNGGSRYLLLRDLAPAGQEGAVVTWQFSQPGEFEYDAGRDEWSYHRRRPDRRQSLLNSGLLFPGETVAVRMRFRLLDLPRAFVLRYFDFGRADLSERVYFETRGGSDLRYRRLVGADLTRRLEERREGETRGGRVVLFPFAEGPVSQARAHAFVLDAPLERRPFTREAAMRKAELPDADETTYTTTLDAWALRAGDHAWLVSPAAVVPLPTIRNLDALFYWIDSAAPGRIEVELDRESIAVAFREKRYAVAKQADAASDRERWFLLLPASELPRFFRDLRELQLSLGVDPLPDGRARPVARRP